MSEVTPDVGASILERVRAAVSRECYHTWFRNLVVREVSGGIVRFVAPNRFVKQWLEAHYHKELVRAATAVLPDVHGVELAAALHVAPDSATALAKVLADALPPERSSLDAAQDSDGPVLHRETLRLLALSPKHRLESFIVGTSNRVAYVGAQSVVESLGQVYNPLLVHGPHGLGKTHLLQGIAHLLRERRPPLKVIFISCEEFTNAYVWAAQNKRLDAFRARFRSCDAFLVDDVQFLAGRERTQEEFLHTFDALRNAHKQIVLTADAAPRDIKRLDPKLVTRFQAELVARLDVPESSLRIRVLCEKAKDRGLHLPHDVAELLATHIENNVRELEGAVCKLFALVAARRDDLIRSPLAPPDGGGGQPASQRREAGVCLHEAQQDARPASLVPPGGTAGGEGRTMVVPDRALALVALRELGYLRSGPVTLNDILDAVSRHYQLTADGLRSAKRHASLVHARHVGMYLSRQLTGHSLGDIGRFYGNRNHATVVHACDKIAEWLKRDEPLQRDVQTLKQVLGR